MQFHNYYYWGANGNKNSRHVVKKISKAVKQAELKQLISKSPSITFIYLHSIIVYGFSEKYNTINEYIESFIVLF